MIEGGENATPNPTIVTKANKDKGESTTKEAETRDMVGMMVIELDEVDRLRAENAQLRLMNESARSASLIRDLEESRSNIHKMQDEYMKVIVQLGEKYGFDPDATEMEPGTGRIVPRGTIRR